LGTIGSFHPLPSESGESTSVLFALATNTPTQRRALHQEALSRLAAASALSDALMTMRVEDHDDRSHVPLLEAIAILSRDARGLLAVMGEAEGEALAPEGALGLAPRGDAGGVAAASPAAQGMGGAGRRGR
jgi:hypothetical protein